MEPPTGVNAAGSDAPTNGGDPLRTVTGDEVVSAPTRRAAGRPAPLQQRDPGRYRLVAEHGRGGIGRVFRAHDQELGRDVAVKELLERGVGSELRFFREALITARLEHPGIVPVHEAGRWPDGTPFYAMKLVAGRPLRELIGDAQTLEQRLALLPHLLAVADAIAYAHDRKIIHRDLKPSNIMVGDFGETVVIDWGIAKDLRATADEPVVDGPYRASPEAGLTAAGSVLGTPAYMAPEQAAGAAVDERTDVYALGAILYQLCTGDVPGSRVEPELFAQTMRKIDPDLATIAGKALAVDPGLRYPHAGALAADLRAFTSGARIAARQYSLAALLAHWLRRHRPLAIAIAAVALVAAVGATLSIREIVAQRDRASAALASAEKARVVAERERASAEQERDRGRLSEARLLLEKDPTQAWALVSPTRPRTAEEALLQARILGAGVAEHVMSVPFRVERVAQLGVDGALVVATADRALYLADVAAGTSRLIDRSLTAPAMLTARGAELIYERLDGGVRRIIVARPLVPGDVPVELTAPGPAKALFAIDEALYVLTKRGELFVAASVRAPFEQLRAGVREAARLGDDELLLCLEAGRLIASSPGTGADRSLGRCTTRDLFEAVATAGASYAIPGDDTTLRFARSSGSGSAPFAAAGTPMLQITDAGLVAAIDGAGIPWMLSRAGASLQRGPRTSARATAVTASGDVVAWGFTDGTIQVRDTATRQIWGFRGHDFEVAQLRIDPRTRRLLSFAGKEIRSWRLDDAGPVVVGELDTQVFNIALDRGTGLAVLDSEGGGVNLARREHGGLRQLHAHRNLAFGVTWHAGRACSSGWDGQVLCTDPVTGRTTVEAALGSPVRWLESRAGHLVYAVADGGVWEAGPEPRLLYRHDAEAYRITLSDDGGLVASCAQDGSVYVHDRATGEIERRLHAHEGLITNISWSSGRFRSTGIDGNVHVWTPTLTATSSFEAGGPIMDHRALGDGFATTTGRSLILSSSQDRHERTFDLGAKIAALGASEDGGYLATATGAGDIVVYDTAQQRFASVSLGRGLIACIEFWDASTALVCGPSGLVASISMEQLTFVDWEHDR